MLGYFFDRGLCRLVCFLWKLWVWEKIHLKFINPWEMKNLPWDYEKGSETIWQTVKPWELRGLLVTSQNSLHEKQVLWWKWGNHYFPTGVRFYTKSGSGCRYSEWSTPDSYASLGIAPYSRMSYSECPTLNNRIF